MSETIKLQILSDLHLEFAPFTMPKVDADVLVLAGDSGSAKVNFMRRINRWSEDRPVVMILGNHEFYGDEFPTLYERLRQDAAPNVHLLQNDSWEYKGVRFLGCTLWTDYQLNGYRDTDKDLYKAQNWLNDYVYIHNPDRTVFHPLDSVAAHDVSVEWLKQNLSLEYNGPTVVVTHHSPSPKSIKGHHVNSGINSAYHSDLEWLMRTDGNLVAPKLWLHGHTHASLDYTINETRVVSNARGYPGESTQYNSRLVISI